MLDDSCGTHYVVQSSRPSPGLMPTCILNIWTDMVVGEEHAWLEVLNVMASSVGAPANSTDSGQEPDNESRRGHV